MWRDGSRPLCSGSQVRADNCRLCAAETDDYGLYCLSQAQSALIQQSHIALIYESHAPRRHTRPLYTILSYAHMLAFASLRSPPPPPPPPSSPRFYCRVSTRCLRTVWPATAARGATCRCRLRLYMASIVA